MTKCGAAPCLVESMPEFAPVQIDIKRCPVEFGSGWNKKPEPTPMYVTCLCACIASAPVNTQPLVHTHTTGVSS